MRIYLLIFFVTSHPKGGQARNPVARTLELGGVSPVARLRGSALLES